MNYTKINACAQTGIRPDGVSDRFWHRYLLFNNMLYAWSLKQKRPYHGDIDKILQRAAYKNKNFNQVIRLLSKACRLYRVRFALYKTYRRFPDVYDGDIDILVKQNEMKSLFKAMKSIGYVRHADGVGRWKFFCNGFPKVEARSSVVYYGRVFMDESLLWSHMETIRIAGTLVVVTDAVTDVLSYLLNTLYGPKYLRLSEYLLFQSVRKEQLIARSINTEFSRDIKLLLRIFSLSRIGDSRFPFYNDAVTYTRWWFTTLALSGISFAEKCKKYCFYWFIRLSGAITGQPYFHHEWIVIT